MSRARIRRGGTPGQPTAPAGASGRRTLTVRRCSPSITRSAAAADWAGWRSRTPSRTTSGAGSPRRSSQPCAASIRAGVAHPRWPFPRHRTLLVGRWRGGRRRLHPSGASARTGPLASAYPSAADVPLMYQRRTFDYSARQMPRLNCVAVPFRYSGTIRKLANIEPMRSTRLRRVVAEV